MTTMLERAIWALHKGLGGNGWAYSDYSGDEMVTMRPHLESAVRAVLMAVMDGVSSDMQNPAWEWQDPEAFCIVMRTILNEEKTND